MTPTPTTPARPRGAAHFIAPLAERFFNGVLPVRLRAWDGSQVGPEDAPVVVLRDRDALRRILARPGELGPARAYVSGDLDVEGDLADGFRRVWASVREHGTSLPGPADWARAARLALSLGLPGVPPPPPQAEARLRGGVNTPGRDAEAVAHHYDLSNDLYGLFLDPLMAYSCGYWTSDDPDYGLADAQVDKLDLVCRKLGLAEGDRLLDVGCGWGALTLHAARSHGARVTAVTLSSRQREYVRARVAEQGLADRVQVRLSDYRDIDEEPFDAIAAVEMGEHVGRRNYPAFAARLHALLRPRGRLLVQQMSRRGAHPGGGPFIETYIAPDMHMRPLGETVALLEDAGLEVRDVHAMREHYVRTVEAWYAEFERRFDEVVALVGEETARVWRLYLVGGALAFEERRMGVDQVLAVRPTPDGRSGMPATRADLDTAR
ncbi:cyclopropane-fatty-acyl-phospholipid synthase [Spinactinospora alkalitolerans]|uniref:Cyclopropane-fatty-acyl-phospholipid synthase n=1 Tax=Spinactinospora alkalitolerans TaxID=687207 RepID=A0A852TWT3_9ACTN|nr:cyclopropane-fatty-acyl-phospholipid synthase family protein [Spinactinospora alkalitolerans]NYE47332.1 cyclopropane-fatty-acyl-phospholipid synthase [Spinactinospora alkalitolerans]